MPKRLFAVLVGTAWSAMLVAAEVGGRAQAAAVQPAHAAEGSLFQTSNECFACHNGLTTPSGEDVSIGISWRSSMMAN